MKLQEANSTILAPYIAIITNTLRLLLYLKAFESVSKQKRDDIF